MSKVKETGLASELITTESGYFPTTKGYYKERDEGTSDCIMLYVLKGSGWAFINGLELNVSTGDLLFLPPNSKHQYGSDNQDPWIILWAHFTGNAALAHLEYIKVFESPLLRIGDSTQIKTLFYELVKLHQEANNVMQVLYVNSLLNQLLSLVKIKQWENTQYGESSNNRVDAIIQLLEKNLDQNFTVSELAKLSGFSNSQLALLFRKKTDCAIIQYHTQLKMKRACILLQSTKIPIAEVALRLGYQDPLYFSRRFQRSYRISPQNFRKMDSHSMPH